MVLGESLETPVRRRGRDKAPRRTRGLTRGHKVRRKPSVCPYRVRRTAYAGNGHPRASDVGLRERKENERFGNEFFIDFMLEEQGRIAQFPASCPEERADAGDMVAETLRLRFALQFGLITGYSVLWGKVRRYPAFIKKIKLFLPGGREELRERLGNHFMGLLRETGRRQRFHSPHSCRHC